MKEKTFTLLIMVLLLGGLQTVAQVNTGTGVAWGSEFFPSSPLVLMENFQGFEFFHSDSTADMGNSNNVFDNDGVTIIYGYKNDSVEVPILGHESSKIKYTFKQCAFAPEWKAAWAFRDGVDNTPNVSNGFVEVSRDYESTPPTVLGYFDVDLSALSYVDGIQWTHSSCGGNKRGVLLLYSTDDGATWDTLRYQGSTGRTGFTKDLFGNVRENQFNCEPSAHGMTWEDGIYYEGSLKLRFTVSDGQVPRIHDLLVYGEVGGTSANIKNLADLKIYSFNKKIRISEPSDVDVYTITGNLVKSAVNTNLIHMNDVPTGIYIVKARNRGNVTTGKVVIQ